MSKPFGRLFKAISLGLLSTSVVVASLSSFCAASPLVADNSTPSSIDLARLTKGELVQGFRTDAVYLNDAGKAVGGRFKHVRSGFTFDYLSVQTAPQAFMWVNTPPTSDMGEAHTQEHLLLGKGNKGRNVATLEEMSMTSSSAMTMQWRTCYHFNTTAGPDVFYEQVQRRLDALLHPDYTDVEVEREVRNFGVSKDSKDDLLKLEEKGTVYNEMVSSVKSPGHALWRAQYANLYGKDHPLYYMAGGTPEGLRKLTSDDIKAFRKSHYVLHNMGMIAAVPKNMPVAEVLAHLNTILSGLEKEAVSAEILNVSDVPIFPPPHPVTTPGQIDIVPYPEKDPEKQGSIELYWPARLQLAADQELLLGLFLSNLAGDPATPLYKKFVDQKTRVMDTGATGVWGSVSDDEGFPISVGLSSVSKANINDKVISQVRDLVTKELATIASWKDGSPELMAFNARVRDRIIATRRSYGKYVNSPPGFGNRWQGSGWMGLFLTVGRGGEFHRSVTLKPEIAFAEKELSAKTNIWRHYLNDWHMTDTVPFAVANRPDPTLLTREEEATRARLSAETERLKKFYGMSDDQAALRAYKVDYDKATAALEELAKHDEPAHLVESLPLTIDDQLEFKESKLDGIPIVSSNFESMTGATAGLAMRADSIESEDLLYLSFLPTMINQVGIILDGKPITYDQMLDLWRQEILSVGCSISLNPMTDRCELVMRGSGNDPGEAERSIIWMERLLKHPDWRVENLPRIRDVIDHSLTSLRNSRQGGYEESWVHGVSSGFWRQDWPLYLNTRCFLTRTHNAQRLRWLLKGDTAPETTKAFLTFMGKLSDAGTGAKREDLKSLLEVLQKQDGAVTPEAFKALVEEFKAQPKDVQDLSKDAAKDLAQCLADIPDDSLKHDFKALCAEISHDVQVPPSQTLAKFDQVRQKLLTTSGARLFTIGAAATQAQLENPLKALLKSIGDSPFKQAKYSSEPFVLDHLREREQIGIHPTYFGFVNANTQQGVFLYSAPSIKYKDLDEESLLRYLAFMQYAGGGAHSIFMKTWGAGLAYSNGLRTGPNERMSYYADKTPALPDTIRFVAEQLRTAPKDLDLSEYSIAGAFSSMSAQSYESRGETMAEALVDGEPPEVVKKFRQAILDLRKKPDLAAALHERMLPQYGRVIPGLGVKGEDVEDAVYMVIGDEKQMKLYADYLKTVAGPDTRLYRIYGRDFWQFGQN